MSSHDIWFEYWVMCRQLDENSTYLALLHAQSYTEIYTIQPKVTKSTSVHNEVKGQSKSKHN